MNLSSFHARLVLVAQYRSSSSSSLVRLVQLETRRVRLSVRARKPLCGQVLFMLFTARTVPGRVIEAFATRVRRPSAENLAVDRVERVVSRRRRRSPGLIVRENVSQFCVRFDRSCLVESFENIIP